MARRQTLYLPVMLGTLAAAVLVACAVALLALSEKAEATFPGKNGRIAYTDWDSGKDFEIYAINPDGSGKRQLTHNDTEDIDPAYSPGGKKIAYAGQDGPKGDLEIYTINSRGGDKFQVTHNDVDDEWPAYSPNGKRIAYTPIEGDDGIYSVKAGGGDKRLVAHNGGVSSYSPDGKRIVYEGFEGSLIKEQNVEDASTNIYTMKAGGGGNVNLTKSPKNASIWNSWPSYSPDGEKIAYMGPDGQIYTIKVGGGGKSRVTNNNYAYTQKLSWGIRP